MTPVDSQQLVAATFMAVGFSLLIGIGLYVWYAAMLAKVFARFGQPAWSAWVPVYNEMQLFKIGRQQPWLALLMYVPLAQIVGLVFKVFALHRISTQSWRGVGTTVLGVLLPPVWATVLATGPSPDPELGRMPLRGAAAGEIPPVAPGVPGGPLAGSPQLAAAPPAAPAPRPAPLVAPFVPAAPVAPVAASGPAAPAAPIVGANPPAAPAHMSAAAQAWASPLNDAPASEPARATAAPVVPHVEVDDSVSSLFAPPSSQPPVAPVAEHGVVAPRVPGRIEPLPPLPQAAAPEPAAAPVVASPAPAADAVPPQPSGAAAAYAALAAPLAAQPPAAQAVPAVPAVPAAPAAPAAPRAASLFDPFEPADAPTIVTGEGDDDPFDRTVVVARRPLVRWRLALEDGTSLELDAPVVVLGRNPRAALTGEQRLVVPDLSRTLSKTHAVLRLDGEQWSVTDLDSTNGVMVPDAGGADRLIDPGVPTPVAGRFVLGTLAVALERDGQQEAPR